MYVHMYIHNNTNTTTTTTTNNNHHHHHGNNIVYDNSELGSASGVCERLAAGLRAQIKAFGGFCSKPIL